MKRLFSFTLFVTIVLLALIARRTEHGHNHGERVEHASRGPAQLPE